MLLPTFFVTLFCVPLGTIIIPAFLDSKEKAIRKAEALVSNVSFMITVFLALLCIALFFSAPLVLKIIGRGFSQDKIEYSIILMGWALPVLLFSGMVIIGNSILNAIGKFAVPSLAQAAVPVIAILFLLLFGGKTGILAVAIGMLAGQLINLLWVGIALKKEGFSLAPRWNFHIKEFSALFSEYVPLVIASFFVSASIPVNNAMASGLSAGSVAAFSLGNKFVLSVTGIIGAGIATVMLPYFSSFVAKNRIFEVRQELSLFLKFSMIISIPVSILIYLVSDEIVRIVFQGGVFTGDDSFTVARVLKFGIIQLPFFTCNILILKFATATRHTGLIMIASVAGLFLNIILNNILMGHMGVAGISLASTISMMMVTFLFLILIYKLGHVSWIDIITISLNWMLYFTIILCFHYKSYAGVVVSVFALLLLSAGHLKISISRFKYIG
jgi:putative peptidoglycan lipid II flippase